jgi:ribosome biogenesis GTPase
MKKKIVEQGKKPKIKQRRLYVSEDNWLEEKALTESQQEQRSFKNETRTLRKKGGTAQKASHHGIIISTAGRNWYILPHHSSSDKDIVECLAAGTIASDHDDSSLLCVGDTVGYVLNPLNESEGLIVQVGERSTRLARRSIGRQGSEQVIISNADQLLIVMSAADPFYNKRLIDRYLIAAEQGKLKPLLCINKCELMDIEAMQEDLLVYTEMLDIPVFFTSAKKRRGLKELTESLKNTITVLSGPSGVGKSSLVNLLTGNFTQRVGQISQRTWKGRHITSSARLFPLPGGGWLADTPGLRELGLWDIHPDDAAFYFHDFDAFYPECRFSSCTHRHEPGCAVKQAVEDGYIDPERYQSYLNIAESLEE